jgi:butyryl-CoA dehydrogenase
VPIIEHADVKRMLLAQKSYVEGGLALELYCARLVDEQHTGDEASAAEAGLLLEVLTPIAKSWPSEWCLEANSLAIQVLGGYGYTRDFPVEQYWRDNRLNMIHEGTHGIQALDLLGRKVTQQQGAGLRLLIERIEAGVARAQAVSSLQPQGERLVAAVRHLAKATRAAWSTGDPVEALANATPYLQAFGHVVLAWMWLELATTVGTAAPDAATADFRAGKRAACDYFYAYELPKVAAWLAVVETREPTCRLMQPAWF